MEFLRPSVQSGVASLRTTCSDASTTQRPPTMTKQLCQLISIQQHENVELDDMSIYKNLLVDPCREGGAKAALALAPSNCKWLFALSGVLRLVCVNAPYCLGFHCRHGDSGLESDNGSLSEPAVPPGSLANWFASEQNQANHEAQLVCPRIKPRTQSECLVNFVKVCQNLIDLWLT